MCVVSHRSVTVLRRTGSPPDVSEHVTEKTLIKTMELPYGQAWAWFADANVVGLSATLNDEERENALSEVQAHWRRACLTVVPDNAVAQQPRPGAA